MPRAPRKTPGGLIYHVLNRAIGKRTLFEDGGDFAAFVKILHEAVERHSVRLLAWCVMSNHWHLLLWPKTDGELSTFMRWLTTTHVRRWHQHRHSSGEGHLYQGRFKSFPVGDDSHLLTVAQLRGAKSAAGPDGRACGVLALFKPAQRIGKQAAGPLLTELPVACRDDWLQWVNEPQTDKEMEQLRISVARGRPFGSPAWQAQSAKKLGLEFTFRKRGRTSKKAIEPN